jgi:acetylornithine deacetylase/succinyl-diaminopimelate desuccinylase-like protein
MVFVPSVKGISHNPAELTSEPDIEAGANVLLDLLLELATDGQQIRRPFVAGSAEGAA